MFDKTQNGNLDERAVAEGTNKYGGTVLLNQFSQKREALQTLAEVFVVLSVRPLADNKMIILRVGRVYDGYRYTTVMDETSTDPSLTGRVSVSTEERYVVHPISFGFGLTTRKPLFQVQAEFIYAFATMTEAQTITGSDGIRTVLPTVSYRAESIGFRLASQLNIQLSRNLGVIMELGYRGLGFYSFHRPSNGTSVGLPYSVSGGFLSGGLSYGW
jgi:hypothetical protein